VADHIYDVYRFADVLGPKFRPENLPLTTAFFSRVVDTGKSVVEPAKDFWNRQRPGELDSRIRPVMKEPKSASYPSGHATAGTLMAIVLSNMIPEKSAELFARSWNFAQNRVVAGAHFPSDIQAGRITGTLVASSLFQDKAFQGDLAAARIELRQALGYPTNPEP
jgi:acid phosphatase (class A)